MALRIRVPLLGLSGTVNYRNAVGPGVSASDQARLAGRLWTPAVLRGQNKLGFWLDASDAATVTCDGSGQVSQLNDKSGFGLHGVQATSGLRPLYLAIGGPQGQGVLSLAGDSLTATTALSIFLATGIMLFSVWRKTGATTSFNAAPLTRTVNNQPSPFDAYDDTRWFGDGSGVGNTSLSGQAHLGTDTRFTSWNILVHGTGPNGIGFEYINGTNTITNPGVSFADPSIIITLGSRGDGVTTMNGLIGEVLALKAQSTSIVERQQVEGYLAHRWGLNASLPASHPHRNAPPLVGNTALRVRTLYTSVDVSGAQIAVPISDITDGSWLNELGSNTNLYASLDESVASDTDYIVSSALGSGASDTCEVGLTVLTDPASSTNHVVSYRYRAQGAGTMNLTVRLMQGATIVASWSHTSVSTTYAVATQTLSGAEANAITDYANLRLRFVATGA